jgi:1-acyl-sn-glycerol-3-phosphate acyltransferase
MQNDPISGVQKLRSLTFQLWFWLYTIPMNLLWLPSLALPRPIMRQGMMWWCQLTIWGLRVFAGVRYEVRGRENLPQEACLIASKHQSMWETIAFNVIFNDPAVVIKRELAAIPFYGWYVQKQGCIVVDRDAHASALKKMVADAKDRLAHGRSVVIFPEGTRKAPGEAPDYKPGVAALYGQLGVPCVPIALNSGRHWISKSPWRRAGTIVVEILPAIPPGLKRQAFMAELETSIETAMTALT